jgi:hypothetical protein
MDGKMFNMSTPVLGRGRGFFSSDGVVRRKENDQICDINLGFSQMEEKVNAGASSFTPAPISDDSRLQITELLEELGSQIGDSILDRLLADRSPSALGRQTAPEPAKSDQASTTLD